MGTLPPSPPGPAASRGPAEAPRPGVTGTALEAEFRQAMTQAWPSTASGEGRRPQEKGQGFTCRLAPGGGALYILGEEARLPASRDLPWGPELLWVRVVGGELGVQEGEALWCSTRWGPCLALSPLPSPDSSLSAAPSQVRLR